MENVCAIISPFVNLLVDPVVRQIGYVFNYNTNIHNLEEEVNQLTLKKQRVQHSVDEARRNPAEEIEADVQHWLNRVNGVLEEAERLLLEVNDRAKKRCFIGICPNLKTRHGLSRKAVKDTEVVIRIKEVNFVNVSRRIIPPGIGPVNGYQVFESRTLVLDEIINALKDVEVNLVGVYGMSGVGKSMLVRKLAAQVEKDGLFKKVVLATVTHKPDLKGIQQQIADWLDYKLEVESIDVRAARLHERLKREGQVLVILDDIWEGFKLESVGIPCDDDHKGGKMYNSSFNNGMKPEVGEIPDDKDRIKLEQRGCKTLITTRNQNVLWKMGVQKEYQQQLQLLKDEEARELFEKNVGDVKDDNLATELVTRCAGLPVLIVILATALKNKELSEWRDAFERIKRFDNEGIQLQVYSPLEVSYNFLGDEEKALFLLCGQLQPQFISICDLLKYSMGLSLFNHCPTVKVARNRLLKVVNDLKRSCLLLESDNDEHVKMHDVVHSFATSVVSQKNNALIASVDNELDEWQEKEKLKQCTAISLQHCKFSMLPEMLECPKLKSFLLYNDDPSLLRISENFFSRMRDLRLMDLSHVHLSPMPQSLKFLENLQALCLDSCVVEDISAIRKLRKLRVLSFTGSTMVRLPPEVGELTCLQVLDLSRSQQLEEVPPNVLSCLTRLEALHIGNSFVQWGGEEGDDGQRNNASLAELKLLPNLVTLDLCIIDAKLLPRDLFSKDLESFKIFIGKEWDWSNKYNSRSMLKLKLDESIQLERVKVLLMKAEDLYLDQLQGIENVLYELHGQGFPLLKHLHIQNSEIQLIIDSVFPDVAFPSLELLDLDNLNNLEKICHGPLKAESFCSLRKLNVRNCNGLKFLFSLSMARHFVRLEEINANSCQIMEEIVVKETGDDSDDDEEIKFAQLCSLTLEDLPKFKSFCSGLVGPPATKRQNFYAASSSTSVEEIVCVDEPENQISLFNRKIALPNLEDLKLYSVSVRTIWSNQVTEQFPRIPKLTILIVHGCGDLKYIFTYFMVESLVSLKRLEVCNCESLEAIITYTQRSREGETRAKILFPKLDYLKLMDLPKLQSFCTGDLIECPLMKELRIDECDQLKTFISNVESTYAESNQDSRQAYLALFDEKVVFPNLEELHIICMHKLKIIWHDQIQPRSFFKLKVLRISHGKELLKIFPSKVLGGFRNLETLDINGCDVLKEVFDLQELTEVQERNFVAAIKLKTLDIMDLPKLEHIWNDDPQGVLSFDNLSSLSVGRCPSLKSIFQASIALRLPQLEKLEISFSEVEEIVVKDKVEATRKFLFPRLKSLTLWSLEKLKCFYLGDHILECPELEELVSYHCYKLELFVSKPRNLKETQMENKFEIQGQQPLFAFKKVLSNLTELSLNMENVEMIRQERFPEDLFHKIKFLHLLCFNDPSEGFPFDFLQKFPNIEKLHVGCSSFKELLPYGGVDEKHVRVLERVRFLILDVLHLMRHLWNPNSQTLKVLRDLETLEIRNCDSLVNLIPSPASFPNLTVLGVQGCQSLVNLITLSTAKSMVNLKKMSVRNCNMVTELVVNEEDESQSQSEIIFDKLESLSLYFLGSLTCFCSASCIIKFPSLEEVFVKQCPRMKVFSQGVVRAPKLQKVYLTQDKGEWRRVMDLNTTIQLMHVDMAVYSGIQHLRFSEFPELQEMWHEQSLPVKFFKSLKTLVVDEYSFSSIAVPSNLLPSLKYVEDLEVRNCESVEQVFGPPCSDDDRHSDHLPMLNNLHLIDLPRLIEVPKEILDFQSLKSLKIYNCSSLRYIVTPPMCAGLVQLQDMEVRNCAMVKEIITEAVAEDGGVNLINFPQLSSITLQSLHGLSNFYSGSGIVQCPSLKEIIIVDCPSAFTSTLFLEPELSATDRVTAPKIRFPNLADLKLSSICVENIWSNQPCIQKLTTLIVDGCGNLKYLFEHYMVENFGQLKKLEICDCKSMEEIIAPRGVGEGETMLKILFPKLEFLKLRGLPKLKNFGSDETSNTTEDGANATLFDKKVAFPNLKELHILNVNWLKMIWHDEILPDSFCELKVLKIEHVKELLNVFPLETPMEFQNLESLVVKNCDSLQAVFGLQVAASELRTLELEEFQNLKHVQNIEDPQRLLSFGNLRSVEVWQCPNLRSLFPVSIARNLQRLELLHIRFCGLEDIVSKEEKLEATPKFVFHRLNLLVLWELQELKSFWSGIQTLECPMLENLVIYHCNRLQAFASERQDLEGHLAISGQQSIFSSGKVVPNLELLALNGKDIKMIQQGQFPAGFFHKLKALQLQCFYDASADFPFHLLQNFQNLKHLTVRHCYLKELFPYGIVGENTKTLSRIYKLNLRSLPFMKHIWSLDCQADQVFQNLKILEVWECNSLVNLEPCPASLQNLTALDVRSCQGLVNLISISTAKSLLNLSSMIVRECNLVTEIIANEKEECQSQSEIIFKKLNSLKLLCLSSLASFSSSASCTIKFPSLEEVVVTECPSMKVFSEGVIKAPKLTKVYLTEEGEKWQWEKDLNTTIQQLHLHKKPQPSEEE